MAQQSYVANAGAAQRFGRRRALLQTAAVALAAVAGGEVLTARRGEATTGVMVFGDSNDAGTSNTEIKSSTGLWTFLGTNTSTGSAIEGQSTGGRGVYGYSDPGGTGIFAESPSGTALYATSQTGAAVNADTWASDTPAVHGKNNGGGDGLTGDADGVGASGVYGNNSGGGYGVRGVSNGIAGVLGYNSGGGVGVFAEAKGAGAALSASADGGGIAVYADSYGEAAPAIRATNHGGGSGIVGLSTTGVNAIGVSGTSTGGGFGVYGSSNGAAKPAVQAVNSGAGPGIAASSALGRGGTLSGKIAQLRLKPSRERTHPTSGARGDFFVDASGKLWYCVRGGASAHWKQLA